MSRKLSIVRESQLTGAARKLVVWLDNEPIGELKRGAREVFEIDEGRHSMAVTLGNGSAITKEGTAIIREGTEDYSYNVCIRLGAFTNKVVVEERPVY